MPLNIIKNDITLLGETPIYNLQTDNLTRLDEVGGNPKDLVAMTYVESLIKAEDSGLKKVAFPLISASTLGLPKREAFDVAIFSIKDFLRASDMEVTLVVLDEEDLINSNKKYFSLNEYISENLNISNKDTNTSSQTPYSEILSLSNNLTEKEICYRANITKETLSQIKQNNQLTKEHAISLCLAFELPLSKAEETLNSLGFRFSYDAKKDLICKYYFLTKDYDIYELNKTLFTFGEEILV